MDGNIVLYGLPAAGIILAIVQFVKNQGLADRWAPVLSLILGIALATIAKLDVPTVGTWVQMELLGIMTGLSASGFYSGQRAIREA